MIGWEKRVLLRHYLEQGMTKAALAKRLGVSRRAVYYWIETDQLDRDESEVAVQYGPRPTVPRDKKSASSLSGLRYWNEIPR